MATEEKDTRKDREHEATKPVDASSDREPVCASFEQAMKDWEQELEAEFEANRAAERLRAEDLVIRINA